MVISKFLSDAFPENKRRGGNHPPIALNLKNGTKTKNITDPLCPPAKLIPSPLLYIPYTCIYLYMLFQSFYDNK